MHLDPLPGNVDVRRYVPHGPLLDRAAIMITHSGHGSVMAAFAHGMPLLCVPFARDQRDVALRAVATGAAVRLRPTGLTPRKLSRAIRQVLERPGYRQAAERSRQTSRPRTEPATRQTKSPPSGWAMLELRLARMLRAGLLKPLAPGGCGAREDSGGRTAPTTSRC
jgi:UDP-glucoronosyl and UDP-glucosyl transferase